MRLVSSGALFFIAVAFVVGFLSHVLYQRWNPAVPEEASYPVTFVPLPEPPPKPVELPVLQAREVEKIKGLAGRQAKIRGRIFRVGYSSKSNTFFLNFGPSSASLTGVIFASAVERFEKSKLDPKNYEGREVELTGEIRDHPQYGLEVIVEDPKQVMVFD